MSGAPAAGAANGPPNPKRPSECTSGDAKTVLTTARLEPSPPKSVSGPVDSLHPAAVSTNTVQAIGLMSSVLTFLYPAPTAPRHLEPTGGNLRSRPTTRQGSVPSPQSRRG